MVTFQMTKDTTEKVLESHRGEMLQTTQKDYDVWWLLQTKFFQIQRSIWPCKQSFK